MYGSNTSITDSAYLSVASKAEPMSSNDFVLPFKYKIPLKDSTQPVVHAVRRDPLALRGILKKELERMIMLGVIKK